MFKRLPKFTRNFYFVFTFFFLIWMLFFDSNDLIEQFRLRKKLKSLEEQKEFYMKKIEEVKKEREELFGNSESLEKYAREKYFMKRRGEDIYIIED